MVDWSYVAGLFDGDGHPAITKQHKYTISVLARITGGDNIRFLPIKDFLKRDGIYAGIHKSSKGKHKTKDGWRQHSSYNLVISGHNDVKKFFQSILPHVLFKKKQVEIALKALKLKEKLKKEGNLIKDNLYLFDELRHELHKLSRKGRKKLKEW